MYANVSTCLSLPDTAAHYNAHYSCSKVHCALCRHLKKFQIFDVAMCNLLPAFITAGYSQNVL